MPPDPTEIATERLILRAHRAEDGDGYRALWTPPAAGPAFTPVLDAEGAWARLLRLVGHRAVYGFAPWLVTARASGRIVGEVGFARFRRGLGADFDADPEAMWILAEDCRGTGFAREALDAAIGALDRRFPGGRSVCMIDPRNAASQRLAETVGFRPFRQAMRGDHEVGLFERTGGE